MVRIGLLLFTFFISDVVSGQNQRIVDSLHEVLVDKTAVNRYSAFYRLAVEYVDVDNRLALQVAQEAEQAARIGQDTASIVRILAKGADSFSTK